MRMSVAILAGAILALAAGPASAIRIGVFFDREGTTCSATIPVNTSRTCWVLAILDGPPEDGVVGAEFRIEGIPQQWFASFSARSGTVLSIGTPLSSGTGMTFASCQRGTSRILELGTVQLYAASQASFTITVTQASSPSHPGMNCPNVVLCDEANRCAPGLPVPEFTLVCAEGLAAYVNGGSCTVDAAEAERGHERIIASPNPGRTGMDLRFAVARAGDVRIQIFDVAGRRVRRHAGQLGPGSHSIRWDGRDDTGRKVPSGIYYVDLAGPGNSSRTRVTLIR